VSSPALSILVIFHKMSRQAENTLYSLSSSFQTGVSPDDYEIVAVENESEDELGRERALAQGKNVRYFRRHEGGVSPVGALNFAFEQSRAPLVGIIIDGARMVSPGVVEYALLAARLAEHPLIVVPGYHIGDQEHHFNKTAGYDEMVEARLLESIDWKHHGYDLFNVSCFSGANDKGFFTRFLESNCFFCTRTSFERIGGADPRFSLPGGGAVNVWMYHMIARLPGSRLIVLAGEGSFHQFHGGVTTAEVDDREIRLHRQKENLNEVFGGPFKGMHRRPLILGILPGQVQRFITQSAHFAAQHHRVCKKRGITEFQAPEGSESTE
jgi:hypothetical protein